MNMYVKKQIDYLIKEEIIAVIKILHKDIKTIEEV